MKLAQIRTYTSATPISTCKVRLTLDTARLQIFAARKDMSLEHGRQEPQIRRSLSNAFQQVSELVSLGLQIFFRLAAGGRLAGNSLGYPHSTFLQLLHLVGIVREQAHRLNSQQLECAGA